MKFSRANLQVVRVVTRNKADTVLRQVRIDADGTTVASDGNAVMAVEPVSEDTIREESALPAFASETDVPEDGVGLVPEVVTEAIRNLPKGNLALELGFVVLTDCSEKEQQVALTTTDLKMNKTVEGYMARKRFPEWRSILKRIKRRSTRKVCLHRKSLIRLLNAVDAACPAGEPLVFLEFSDTPETDGILLRAVAVETGQRVIGYLMPMDTGEDWLKLSPWEQSVFARAIKRLKGGRV